MMAFRLPQPYYTAGSSSMMFQKNLRKVQEGRLKLALIYLTVYLTYATKPTHIGQGKTQQRRLRFRMLDHAVDCWGVRSSRRWFVVSAASCQLHQLHQSVLDEKSKRKTSRDYSAVISTLKLCVLQLPHAQLRILGTGVQQHQSVNFFFQCDQMCTCYIRDFSLRRVWSSPTTARRPT